MRGRWAFVSAIALGFSTHGCGGGGGGSGGGGGEARLCASPTTAALALRGDEAPDTGGGSYLSFGDPLDAAAGGFVAFGADLVGGAFPTGVFVAPPSAPVRLAWGVGGPDNAVEWIRRVVVTEGGLLAAVADYRVEGELRTAVLTARVDGSGEVVERTVAFVATSRFDVRAIEVGANEDVFLLVDAEGGVALYRMDRMGDALEAIASEGDPVPGFPDGSEYGADWGGFSVDESGEFLAFSATVTPGDVRAVFATDFDTTRVVARDGDLSPAGDALDQAFVAGPLVASQGGGVSVVAWQGAVGGGGPDEGVFLRRVFPDLGPVETLVAPGEDLPGGGAGATAITETEAGAYAATVEIRRAGAGAARSYYDVPAPGTVLPVVASGDAAPGGGGAGFLSFPSVDDRTTADTDAFGRFGFSATLEDGSAGIWTYVPDCGIALVAFDGDPVPDVPDAAFSSLGRASLVVAGETMAFRTAVLVGGDALTQGVFRTRLR
jgi:hypothetical protein